MKEKQNRNQADAKSEDAARLVPESEAKKLQVMYEKRVRDLEEENEILRHAINTFAKKPK